MEGKEDCRKKSEGVGEKGVGGKREKEKKRGREREREREKLQGIADA